VTPDATHLDLGAAVRAALVEAGMRDDAILDDCPSTASTTRRFYSYRAEGGTCGRHGAIAVLHEGGLEEVNVRD
jgi:copper oxidase (laccase) domain-containing protein